MANFNTLTSTDSSSKDDEYLLRQGSTDKKQTRDSLAAGLSNARWSADADYDAGSNTVGSDGINYQAVTASGKNTPAGVVDPTTDTNENHWKKFVNYKETGGLVRGDIETNSFVKAPEIKTNYIQGLNTDLPLNLEPLTPDAYGSFNGTGTPSLLKNLNIATVTRTSTGNYKVDLSITMPDAEYIVVPASDGNEIAVRGLTSTSFIINTYDYNGAPFDRGYISFIVYGGKL